MTKYYPTYFSIETKKSAYPHGLTDFKINFNFI